MKSIIIVVCFVFAVLSAGVTVAGITEKGSAEITLDGGRKGTVDFPHQKHQNTLGDCKICHDIFPQKLGVIKALKDEGKLEKKQVMNNCREMSPQTWSRKVKRPVRLHAQNVIQNKDYRLCWFSDCKEAQEKREIQIISFRCL